MKKLLNKLKKLKMPLLLKKSWLPWRLPILLNLTIWLPKNNHLLPLKKLWLPYKPELKNSKDSKTPNKKFLNLPMIKNWLHKSETQFWKPFKKFPWITEIWPENIWLKLKIEWSSEKVKLTSPPTPSKDKCKL